MDGRLRLVAIRSISSDAGLIEHDVPQTEAPLAS
jgi:hypothetical protein